MQGMHTLDIRHTAVELLRTELVSTHHSAYRPADTYRPPVVRHPGILWEHSFGVMRQVYLWAVAVSKLERGGACSNPKHPSRE